MSNLAQPNKPLKPDNLNHTYSLKELLSTEFPEILWVVNSLVRSGATTMVSAQWGQCKSWVCQHIAICVASGSPVFGHFAVEQAGVMIVNEEDCLPDLQDRMRKLAPPSDDLPIYFRAEQDFKLNEKTVALLLAEALQKSVGLVIFDSLRAIHTSKENDSDEMQVVMDSMKPIARAGIAVIFIHHERKRAQGQKASDPNGADTRGSGAINAAAFGHFEIEYTDKEDNGEKFIIVTQRKNKGAEIIMPFKVKVEKTESGGLSFEYVGEQMADGSADRSIKAVAAALRDSGGRWLSLKDLVARKVANAKNGLREMREAGLVATKTRKELEADGVALGSAGKHNEVFYALVSSPEPTAT